MIRNLKPPDARSAIGIDALKIIPPGTNGYTHINVIVNLFTKLTFLEPVKGVTALTLANTTVIRMLLSRTKVLTLTHSFSNSLLSTWV